MAAVRRADRPSGLVWKRTMMCGSPIVPSTNAISSDSVDSTGWPPPSVSSSGRVQRVAAGRERAADVGHVRARGERPRRARLHRVLARDELPGRAAVDHRGGLGDRERGREAELHRRLVGEPGELDRLQRGRAHGGSDRGDQPDRGPDEQHELEHELERLHVGGGAHPAERQGDRDRRARDDDADPVRRAAHHAQHLARRLELGHQVEGGDHEDDHRRERAQAAGAQAGLGEVRHGQRARAAHGRGDEREHRHVARGEPDRVPQRPDPVLHDEPGDAEERRRREVLPRHRRGVERGRDAPRRDEEVRGAAHRGDPAGADQQCDRDDEEDRGADHRGFSPSSPFDAFGAAQLDDRDRDQPAVGQHRDGEPRDADARHAHVVQLGEGGEQQRQPDHDDGEQRERGEGRAQLHAADPAGALQVGPARGAGPRRARRSAAPSPAGSAGSRRRSASGPFRLTRTGPSSPRRAGVRAAHGRGDGSRARRRRRCGRAGRR